jgi:hypothetical protein
VKFSCVSPIAKRPPRPNLDCNNESFSRLEYSARLPSSKRVVEEHGSEFPARIEMSFRRLANPYKTHASLQPRTASLSRIILHLRPQKQNSILMADSKPFQGQVILITGAARGIGKATANYLAARGATLSLGDISYQELAVVAREIKEVHPEHRGLTQVVDVCDPESVKAWVEVTRQQLGRIDGCFNNAGKLTYLECSTLSAV